jgi:hypothetical protein
MSRISKGVLIERLSNLSLPLSPSEINLFLTHEDAVVRKSLWERDDFNPTRDQFELGVRDPHWIVRVSVMRRSDVVLEPEWVDLLIDDADYDVRWMLARSKNLILSKDQATRMLDIIHPKFDPVTASAILVRDEFEIDDNLIKDLILHDSSSQLTLICGILSRNSFIPDQDDVDHIIRKISDVSPYPDAAILLSARYDIPLTGSQYDRLLSILMKHPVRATLISRPDFNPTNGVIERGIESALDDTERAIWRQIIARKAVSNDISGGEKRAPKRL